MRRHRLIPYATAAAVLVAAAGCAGSSSCESAVEKSPNAYLNSFDFVWQSALDELSGNWRIEKEDRRARTITTDWNLQLSPFAGKGRRDRLVVTISGSPAAGWQPEARQESETNMNEENPLDLKSAKWKEMANDGGLASRFLQNLDTRMRPDERWREQLDR
jgi:hypothetical protein